MIIAIDVDGVLADLVTPWLDEYNYDSGDHLTPEDITEYDITTFVKKEYKGRMQEYIWDGRIYRGVLPHSGAEQFTWDLHKLGHKIVYVTKSPVNSLGIKYHWLNRWGFYTSEIEGYDTAGYYEVLDNDKSLIGADILLDDHVVNVNTFTGKGVLMADKPWSRNKIDQVVYHVKSFDEFLRLKEIR